MSEETTEQFPSGFSKLILARFDAIDSQLGSIASRLATVETRLENVEARLESLETGQQSLATRVTNLEEKVDRLLMDTRPIWEQVLARLDKLESGQEQVLARLDKLESGQEEFRAEVGRNFRTLERRFLNLAEDVIAVRTDQRDLAYRMDKLESESVR